MTLTLGLLPPASVRSQEPPKAEPKSAERQAALEQVRAQVSVQEQQLADTRNEVERHLADVTDAPASEEERAEAAYRQAGLDTKTARITAVEYDEGRAVQEIEMAKGEIALAKSEFERSANRLNWIRELNKQGKVIEGHVIAASLELKRATFAQEQAETKLQVFERYTRPREFACLNAEVQKRVEAETSAKATWEAAQAKVKLWEGRTRAVKSAVSQTHVAALLAEAAAEQAQVIDLLQKAAAAGKATAASADKAQGEAAAARDLLEKARKHEDASREKLTDTLALARLVQTWHDQLREEEDMLRKSREVLKVLSRPEPTTVTVPIPSRTSGPNRP